MSLTYLASVGAVHWVVHGRCSSSGGAAGLVLLVVMVTLACACFHADCIDDDVDDVGGGGHLR